MTEMTERLKEIEAKKEELRNKLDAEGITLEEIEAIENETRGLVTEEKEIRAKSSLKDALKPSTINETKEEKFNMTEREERAKTLVESKKLEMRAAVLSTGSIAKPTKVDGINGIAEGISSIVDDVKAVALTGNGAYTVAYKKSGATADDITDGEEISESEADFDYVTINPAEWGVVGYISKQVAKVSPLTYLAELEKDALLALRAKAEAKIFNAVTASNLAGKRTVAIGADFLRELVLGHKSIVGKGACKLYINQEDLIALGKVRGTNEKKPLYSIEFSDDSMLNGTISEGGVAVAFSITDKISAGTQVYGQPQTIELPMWDEYSVETDESVRFTKNQIAYRGVQTANADLCAVNGMEIITQA